MISKAWDWLGIAIVVAIMVGVGATLTAALRSDGKVDYCYVERGYGGAESSVIKAHRPWRSDSQVQKTKDAEEAVRVATAIQCPLR